MRVLHIGKFYPPAVGGMERFLEDLLTASERSGMHVAALVHQAPNVSPSDQVRAISEPAIYRVPTLGQLLYAPISPSFPLHLHRAILRFKPQVLHFHLPNTSAMTALAIPAARRLPWVLHWHADVGGSVLKHRFSWAYRLYQLLEQRLLARSDAIIATSQPYLASSEALKPWIHRCRVIPLGLDDARLVSPDTEECRQANLIWERMGKGMRVLAVGRLTYYKGHETLIRSAVNLPETRVIIAGGGECEQRLQAVIHRLDLDSQVTLTGFVAETRLAALLATCDLLCLPSLDRSEAFGIVLLEAMRFAKPVVVSDIPGSGTGWVVRQAENGLLVPPGQEQPLARALLQLARDQEQRLRLGRRGQDALERCFGIDAVAAEVAEVYAKVLERHDRATC